MSQKALDSRELGKFAEFHKQSHCQIRTHNGKLQSEKIITHKSLITCSNL